MSNHTDNTQNRLEAVLWLNGLIRHFAEQNPNRNGKATVNAGCRVVAKKLGYSMSTIRNVANGSANPSAKLCAAIMKYKIKPKRTQPKRKRYRVHIEFDNQEQKDAAMKIDNDERVRRLLG